MTSSDWIALIALIIAIIGAVLALLSFNASKRTAMLQINLDLVSKGNDFLCKNLSLLEFHGVNLKELKELNITEEEFIYILNSFYAGQAFYYIQQPIMKVKLSEYRKKMLENPKVQAAWKKIIRPHLIGETKYVKSIDKFYANLKSI